MDRDASLMRVWVRTEMVEAILANNGKLPKGWKASRKRARSSEKVAWGWARAYAVPQSCTTPIRVEKETETKGTPSPFGHVRLRKVRNSPISNDRSPSWTSPNRRGAAWSQTVPLTVTIDDEEFAPAHLQNVTVTLDPENDATDVCMANSWWHKSKQETGELPPDDLTTLTHLHEPAVVFFLKRRYESDAIYTYTGKILLALNPFRVCNYLYGENVMRTYWSETRGERPPPHIYAIAQDAHGSMMRAMQSSSGFENQSILVSGESGAGKTVTTKIIMSYLATLSQQYLPTKGDGSIEAQVLQSNPILESFGNARTVRNDNSSRFGKFVEIRFLLSGCLVSASIETYLLEKIRLISQAPGERNYHIFYELLEGLPQKERRDLLVGNVAARDFRMTSISGTFDRRDGVKDRETFRELRAALDTVGFLTSEQQDIFTVICALLHASNLTFSETASESSRLDRSNPSLKSTLTLLGVSQEALENALCFCAIEARGEVLHKNMSVSQATKALEALMKATYGALFTHIVRRVNNSITSRRVTNGPGGLEDFRTAYIGVLDIFGFESFAKNSFEQLCINYCNEALQQQFNRYVFKLEQQEYEREGIQWSFISFPDNQDVLDLIEKKISGILSILDEQCRIARSSDITFARAAYEQCSDHSRFVATKSQKVSGAFSIHHYAGLVEYDTSHFLEKNKDELPKESTDLLMSSSRRLLASLGSVLRDPVLKDLTSPPSSEVSGAPPSRRQFNRMSSSILRESVGSQFTAQLRELRNRIDQTTPHYVRCLKPNDDLVPNNFHPLVIADQLRCAGVLEAVRVSRVGFPQRYTHAAFVQRYGILARKELHLFARHRTGRDLCEVVVNAVSLQVSEMFSDGEDIMAASPRLRSRCRGKHDEVEMGIQMGRTKVFLRRQVFDKLEVLRNRKMETSAIAIQSVVRRSMAQKRFNVAMAAIVVLQNCARRIGAIRYFRQLRQLKSAVMIQCAWRCFVAERNFMAVLCIAQWCQSAYRGMVAREICAFIMLEHKAIVIQKHWRRHCACSHFRSVLCATVYLQSLYRAWKAKSTLKQLKLEARDLEIVSAERDRFREEALRLRLELKSGKGSRSDSPSRTKVGPDRSDSSEELQRLRDEIELLQLQLRKVQLSKTIPSVSGAELLNPDSYDLVLKDFRSIPYPRTTPPSRAQIPTRISAIPPSPDRSVSSYGSMTGRSISTKGHSPGLLSPLSGIFRKSTSLDKVDRSIDFFTPPRYPPLNSATSPSLLDSDGNCGIMTVSPLTKHIMESSQAIEGGLSDGGIPGTTLNAHEPPVHDEAFRFRRAIRQGKQSTILSILESSKYADLLINECDLHGYSPLHIAVFASHVDIAVLLLEQGAVANVQDLEGNTPLHLASTLPIIELLLEKGGANPNIPNAEGVCAIHLAVQRLDVSAVECILSHHADVNVADNTTWFTPLHLITHSGVGDHLLTVPERARGRIAGMLCEGTATSDPDLNYQDREGNTPLHHAVMLTTSDASEILTLFLEQGGNPNISNKRGQTPLHLLCHNDSLRKLDISQEMLHDMLFHGADPNRQSLTGCTALHLSLYHRDIDSAIQLVNRGAELNLLWIKPKRWQSFWDDMGSSETLSLDMVQDEHSLHRLLAAINKPQKWAPARAWCMHCKALLGTFARALHCRHCGRIVCGTCSPRCLGAAFFPKSFEVHDPTWVCIVCEKILVSRKEDNSSITQPTSTLEEDDSQGSF